MNTLWTKLSVVAAGTAIFALACTVTSGDNDGTSADDSASDDDVAVDSGTPTEDATTTDATDGGDGFVLTCGANLASSCATCAKDKCCTELSACWENADCKDYAECVIDCQSKPDADGGVDGCLKDVCSAFETVDIVAKDDTWRACLVGATDADGGTIPGKCETECGN